MDDVKYNPGGGDDLIIPLDTYAEADLLPTYPPGISVMPVSDTAAWDGFAAAAEVTTERAGTSGGQTLRYDDTTIMYREWWDSEDDWGGWWVASRSGHNHDRLYPLFAGADAHAEADTATAYQMGFTAMVVSSGANWGPNTGEAGAVETFNDGTNGFQTFTQYSNGNKYSRGYASSAWSAWVALQ